MRLKPPNKLRYFTIFIACLGPDDLDAFRAQLNEFYADPKYTVCTNFDVEIMQFDRSQLRNWVFSCPTLSKIQIDAFHNDLCDAINGGAFIIVPFTVNATFVRSNT